MSGVSGHRRGDPGHHIEWDALVLGTVASARGRRRTGLSQRDFGPLTDRADGPELRRTLRVWLSHHGQWEATARELGLHRHTVKAAVRQAASMIDLDLDSVDARAELWLLLSHS